jgi:hypothetical protein
LAHIAAIAHPTDEFARLNQFATLSRDTKFATSLVSRVIAYYASLCVAHSASSPPELILMLTGIFSPSSVGRGMIRLSDVSADCAAADFACLQPLLNRVRSIHIVCFSAGHVNDAMSLSQFCTDYSMPALTSIVVQQSPHGAS